MTLLQVMADNDAAEVRLRTDDANLIGKELGVKTLQEYHAEMKG